MSRTGAVTALIAAAVLSVSCENTRAGAGKDAEIAAEKARQTGEQAAEATAEAARDAAPVLREAGEAVVDGAERLKDRVAGATETSATTAEVKAALMADRGVDSTKVDVDTDAARRVVTLRGSVPTAAQRATAERIAREKADGYQVINELRIAG